MKPAFTFILYTLFVLFVAHSLWNLLKIFKVPTCNEGGKCYFSYLNSKPNLALLVYISDNSRSNDYHLIYSDRNFDYDQYLEKELQFEISKTARHNGSLFIHTVVLPQTYVKGEPSLHDAVRMQENTYLKGQLTKYAVPKKYAFNLLNDQTKTQSVHPVTHIKSRYAIVMCTDELTMSYDSIPMELIQLMRVNNHDQFLPIMYKDFMQTRIKDLVEIDANTKNATFTFIYSPMSIGKLRFLVQIEAALKQFLLLGFTEKDLDEIKGILVDTNVYLLCATVFIGSVHLLLDFLSFKNDISFWKSNRTMAGLSTRTVLWRAFSQVIIFLYLLDEGTSLLVLIPAAVGTVIEFWKVMKVLRISISLTSGIRMQGRSESKEEAETRKYDEECMKYLSYFLYPLCAAAAVYSLMYQPHKSWYSWTISSLVNGVYAFGFLFMLPQLFVNYRLKSVAALPWRTFTYKAFNTFIDDVFAFVITMPTAHRVACFRDDVVFLIYLYQRWLYPVDKGRRDEAVAIDEGVVEVKKNE